MKTKFFFFAMLVSVAASAQTDITVTPISADYANQIVKFSVSWANSSRNTTHNSKVWVFIDYRTVTNNVPSGSWARALISGTPTATTGTPSRETGNDKGFWLQGTSGSTGTYNATVTVKLSGVPAKFNWCAYVSDFPPNVTANNGTYTFKGTPPFTLIAANGTTTQTVSGKTLTTSELTITPTTIKDKTECPGVFCIYTGSDLYIDATHLCQQRTSGAGNWQAYIRDTRDNQIYRIVQMPTNTWWMAQDLMWDGRPSPSATGYTVRGVARSCGSHYGCGRTYNATATGAGAYSGSASSRRSNAVCPSGWLIPSANELCPYATNASSPQPYLGAEEFGGPDTYGLSLYVCATGNWTCGTVHTAYVGGYAGVWRCYRYGDFCAVRCDDTSDVGGARNVRCVRDL